MSHPDSHQLTDWHIYGPRDERIADRVEALAKRGLRLAEIEDFILAALDARLAEEPVVPADPA